MPTTSVASSVKSMPWDNLAGGDLYGMRLNPYFFNRFLAEQSARHSLPTIRASSLVRQSGVAGMPSTGSEASAFRYDCR
jgi:hypothetical protein